MNILNEIKLESNRKMKVNFDGGNLSSDAGLVLVNELASKIGLKPLLDEKFHTNDTDSFRIHTDTQNLLQMMYQIVGAYFEDDRADSLTFEPVFQAILDKERMASQPTLSRFFNRMDGDTLKQFNEIAMELRRRVYSIEMPKVVLFDIDTTLLETYGSQEGAEFNFHYQSDGYHPLLCFDGITGDLLKVCLREGAKYCSKGVAEFMEPLFREFRSRYPDVLLFLRADSGFATPELYTLCEKYGVGYVIRLKENDVLHRLAEPIHLDLYSRIREDSIGYAVAYGEFQYQAGSWEHPRRVVCKIEKPEGQFIHQPTFLVTTMNLFPKKNIDVYCNRGRMETFIRECKDGFDFSAVSSHSMVANANRLELHGIAYNLINWLRRLVLPESMKRSRIDTLRLKLFKVAARVVHSAGYVVFKLCSSFPYQNEFREAISNIEKLQCQTA